MISHPIPARKRINCSLVLKAPQLSPEPAYKMKTSYPFLLLALCLQAFTLEANAADSITVEGLITPRDDTGLYVRNADGQFEIEWAKNTRVALDVNARLLRGIKGGVLGYRVHSSNEVIDFPLPKGPVTGIVEISRRNQFEKALKEAQGEKWISERGLSLHFGKKLPGQLPTADDPRFVGLWDPSAKPRTLAIKDVKYELSMKKGGQANVLLYNVIGTDDCKPFVNRARVIGRKRFDHLGSVVIAAVIDDDDLGIDSVPIHCRDDIRQRGGDCTSFVAGGDQDGEGRRFQFSILNSELSISMGNEDGAEQRFVVGEPLVDICCDRGHIPRGLPAELGGCLAIVGNVKAHVDIAGFGAAADFDGVACYVPTQLRKFQ